MKLQNIYAKDINRNINGVVKADQNGTAELEQEFNEYIVTKELRRHFEQFYGRYVKSLGEPTDDIGVWISGFFGSGKSHFLKILSYLLENASIGGKPAIDYFEDKIDDPVMYANMKKCCEVPTESILFNIDVKSSIDKDKTAVLKVFAKVFYEHLGYYGTDLKVARFEQYLDRQGKLDAFKKRFEELRGETWEESRETFEFWQDEVTQATSEILGIGAGAANNWFENNDVSGYGIDSLIDDIKKYIDSKGNDFRLIFCVDELGQYMGENTDLILNAQSIVEEIGTKCGGRVWVIVTSQEAIDEVTRVKAQAYSKIQGRFKTRLSLTSSSVDEVIKKRILDKSDDAAFMLKAKYAQSSSVLKNLITFHDAKKSYKGYADETEFAETYPFIPYQFNLFQDVLNEIRKHGNTGAHHSSGERSMLSGFQEVAQCLNDRDDDALVPFYLFYDSVNSFLESTIRLVVDRCQRDAAEGNGIEPYDVSVLKLLYLIKYIKDIPSTPDNVATLMADDINVDKVQLKESVKASLERLLSQNYIGKNGYAYTFLTNDEQDVEREIKNIVLDSQSIVAEIHDTVFQNLYLRKAVQVGENSISFDKYVDDSNGGSAATGNEICLRIITAASDYSESSEPALIMKSQTNNEAICLLSDDYDYYSELESALKVIKYTKTNNTSAMPDSIQEIVQKKRRKASESQKEAKELIAKAIVNGTFFINGEKTDVAGATAEAKLNNAMTKLVESVYNKMGYIRRNFKNDAEILEIFNSDQITLSNSDPNTAAIDEVSIWIDIMAQKHRQIVMSDVLKRYKGIPYGWNEADVAAVIATLVVAKRICIKYGGAIQQNRDERLVELLRKKSEVDKTVIEKRVAPDATLIRNVKSFLVEYLNIMNINDDEDELADRIVSELTACKNRSNDSINKYYTSGKPYPGIKTLKRNITVIEEVLKSQKDHIALFRELLNNQDELLDLSEDLESVYRFLDSQIPVFEKGYDYLKKIKAEEAYLESVSEAAVKIAALESIVNAAAPYNKISEISSLIDEIDVYFKELLELKKQELTDYVDECAADILEAADGDVENSAVKSANSNMQQWRRKINAEDSIVRLDAMKSQIDSKKQEYIIKIFSATDEAEPEQKRVSVITRQILVNSVRLTSEEEIDEYVERIRAFLKRKLSQNDELQIM